MDLDQLDMESLWSRFLTMPEMANWMVGMRDSWKDKLSKNRPALCKGIDPEPNLFSHLESLTIFNKRTCKTCANNTGKYNQVSAILDSLAKRPYEDFVKFCKALVYLNQHHIVRDYLSLIEKSKNMPPSDAFLDAIDAVPSDVPPNSTFSDSGLSSWKEMIRNNYPALSAGINPDDGLLDQLASKGIIADYLLDTYTAKVGKTNRVNAILDHLIMKRPVEDFVKFCECLELTNQGWVVTDLLNPDTLIQTRTSVSPLRNDVTDEAGGIDAEPLYRDWKKLLIKNHTELIDNFDPTDDVIAKLVDAKVMNAQGMEICKEKQLDSDKVEYILDHMRRRSTEDFGKLCKILKASGQEHIVEKYLTMEAPVGSVQIAVESELRQEIYHTQPQDLNYIKNDAEHTSVQPTDAAKDEHAPLQKNEATVIRLHTNDSQQNPVSNREMHGSAAAGFGDGKFPISENQTSRPSPVLGESGEPVEESHREEEREKRELLRHPTQVSGEEPAEPYVPENLEETHAGNLEGRVVNPTNADCPPVPGSRRRQAPIPAWNDPPTIKGQVFTQQPNRPIDIEEVRVTQCSVDFFDANRNKSYAMFKKRRGQCIIINNHKVFNAPDRDGTQVDGRLLAELFHQLHFRVTEHKNLTSLQIKERMINLASDPSLAGDQCLVLFFLSHGEQVLQNGRMVDSILGSDGKQVFADEDILNVFTGDSCPQLKTKPKLVFFQACRGVNYDFPDAPTITESDGPPKSYRDFLVLYPTQGDFRSFRNTALGSWYVNAIVRVFMERAHNTGLCQLMNAVNALMSQWTSTTAEKESHGKTQIAQFHSNFTKEDLYFFPGIIM